MSYPRNRRQCGDHPAAFWRRVDQTAGPEACWPWTLSTTNRGYGQVKWGGTMALAHRVAWILSGNPAPTDGKVLTHRPTCVTRCCNPAHMSVVERSSLRRPKGESHGQAVLTDATARLAHARLSAGESRHDVARDVGCAARTLESLESGKSWRHLGLPPIVKQNGRHVAALSPGNAGHAEENRP